MPCHPERSRRVGEASTPLSLTENELPQIHKRLFN